MNYGSLNFTKVTGNTLNQKSTSRGLSWGDINNDGLLDLGVANQANINDFIFINHSSTKNWLKVKLIGSVSNKSAIGATVKIKSKINGVATWQMREISGQTGYCSQNDLIVHFGLDSASKCLDSMIVIWPSGFKCVYQYVPINQLITVSENCAPIAAIPNLNLGADTTYCSNFSRKLTSYDSTTIWSTGVRGLSITVDTPGIYWARLYTICGDTLSDTIKIFKNKIPVINLGGDTAYCGSFSRTLSVPISNGIWNNGIISNSIVIDSAGTYSVQVKVCGVTLVDTIKIIKYKIPIANLGVDTTLCQGKKLTLNVFNAGATYLWQDGSIHPNYVVSSSGKYSVTVSQNGCNNSDTVLVTISNSVRSINLGNDTTYCANFSRVLSVPYPNGLWNNNVIAPSIIIDSGGVYSVQVYVCGDTLKDSINISQSISPIINLGMDTVLCAGKILLLDAKNKGSEYLWQDNSTGQTLQISQGGKYGVTVSNGRCLSKDSLLVTYIFAPLPFSIGADTTLCEDSTIRLNAFQPSMQYRWNTGASSPSINVSQQGQYQVIDCNSCGSQSASINIKTETCNCLIAYPTAFSPNNDGINDYFKFISNCNLVDFQVSIYNRWGEKIFSSFNPSDKWDGTYKNALQPSDVYVYIVKYTELKTKTEKAHNGTITLIR